MRSVLSVAVLCGAMGAAVFAQAVPEVKLVASPPGQAAIEVAGQWEKTEQGGQAYRNGKWIVVDYGRPLLRGRADIFGAGADYGTLVKAGGPVWRAGANNTTRLTTQVPLQIGDKTLAPGVYNVFVDLKPGNWTLVMSNQPVQEKFDPNDKVRLSGAYNYDPKFDLLRVPMTVRTGDVSVEQFTINFTNVTAAGATMTMAWDKTVAAIDLKIAAGPK
ncbi:MAG: DUF2911 domain-containing protein [Acidobacteriota bacterium]|nr:DUF2911 domain-containing protein [Acidobacteriota bacterium]MDP2388904.1 DUF2911 domain-containing protein [Acidobacteriota bacterium]